VLRGAQERIPCCEKAFASPRLEIVSVCHRASRMRIASSAKGERLPVSEDGPIFFRPPFQEKSACSKSASDPSTDAL